MKNLRKLIEIVNFAYGNCEIYKSLYVAKPLIQCLEDFKELPRISMFDFNRNGLTNILSSNQEPKNVIPFDFSSFYENCVPFFLTLEDSIFFRKEIIYLLNLAEINHNEKILLLFGQKQCYLGFELANALLEAGYSTYVFCLNDYNYPELLDFIKSYKINNLLFLSKAIKKEIKSLDKIRKVILVNSLNDFHKVGSGQRIDIFSLYYKRNIGFVAISNLKEGRFRYNPDQFYIETEEQNDIVITCLNKRAIPCIRYCTYDKGIVYDNNTFLIRSFFDD